MDTDACAKVDFSYEEQQQLAFKEYRAGYEEHPEDAAWALGEQLKRIDDAEKSERELDEQTRIGYEKARDTEAVSHLGAAMREKLAETRKYRGGWWTQGCTVEKLSQMLWASVAKGDPVDVANYCAFIAAKGGKIAPCSTATAEGIVQMERQAEKRELLGPELTDAEIREAVTGKEAHYTSKAEEGWNNQTDRKRELFTGREGSVAIYNSGPDVLRDVGQIGIVRPPNIGEAFAYAFGLGKHMPPDVQYSAAAMYFVQELVNARQKFPDFRSAHEGLALIEEELAEMREHVHTNPAKRDYVEFRKEVVQLGAMVLAMLVEIVDTVDRKS